MMQNRYVTKLVFPIFFVLILVCLPVPGLMSPEEWRMTAQ
jgi:hypothetical protein